MLLSLSPLILWIFLVHHVYFFSWWGFQLVIRDFLVWRLGADYIQHITPRFHRIFENLVTSMRNGTFSRTFSIPLAGSTLYVGFSVCVLSVAMPLLREVTTITGDSVPVVVVNCFATRIDACSWISNLNALCDSMLESSDRSLSFHKIGIGAECIGTNVLSMGKIPLMQWSMYLVPNRKSVSSRIYQAMCKLLGFLF